MGYIFNTICDCPDVRLERVFPTKQRIVKKIHDYFKDDDRLVCIVLFGSAVTISCNMSSDVDLLVRLSDNNIDNETKNDISERLQEFCDWKADIIWYDRITPKERIYNNILKGVQIV